MEEDPPGTLSDNTSTVLWLQTPCGLYCDLRVPLIARPADTLEARIAQRSFAGRLSYTGDRTTWHRELDFRPYSGTLDVGDNTLSEDGNTLTELGVHDNYLEVWQRTTDGFVDGKPVFLAMELEHSDRRGVWVVVGSTYGVAIGRAADDPVRLSGAKSFQELFTTSSMTPAEQVPPTTVETELHCCLV